MPNLSKTTGVGDRKSPPLMATESGLRNGAEQANQIQADPSTHALQCSALSDAIAASDSPASGVSRLTCKQTLWFSFFFDGTGNNMEADEGFLKHSNIAKLYRVRKKDNPEMGISAIYIPGVATYFAEVGDDGGSASGKVAGAMGEARINYALMEMDKRMRRALEMARAPANAIVEINIAVFGFSRGAALARAFVNKLLASRCQLKGGKFFLVNGNWPLRVRFMGLFDTVASVGQPMSSNTTETWGAVTSNVERVIKKRLSDYKGTRPQSLAFSEHGVGGADPAPGSAHGHRGYGSSLAIHESVEEVRHFVAANEIRNSFPVDSISTLREGKIFKPAHFYEVVYPGVHSDVGGGYAPAECGRSPTPAEQICVIPLIHMYKHAIKAGVPLLNPGAWIKINTDDFAADEMLTSTYDSYIRRINAPANLGHVINNHTHLYFSWRFRSIRLKQSGDKTEAISISSASSKFKEAGVAIDSKLSKLQVNMDSADIQVSDLESQIRESQMDGENEFGSNRVKILKAELQQAREKYDVARQDFLREKSRKDTLPNMTTFQAMLDLYDRQLMLDVQAVLDVLNKTPARFIDRSPFSRSDLRPHYRALLDAYEAEFIHKKGLSDKTIIHFFDEYIHDSLAGFGADATLPSDPRVVYLGGDVKFAFASLDNQTADIYVA